MLATRRNSERLVLLRELTTEGGPVACKATGRGHADSFVLSPALGDLPSETCPTQGWPPDQQTESRWRGAVGHRKGQPRQVAAGTAIGRLKAALPHLDRETSPPLDTARLSQRTRGWLLATGGSGTFRVWVGPSGRPPGTHVAGHTAKPRRGGRPEGRDP